MGVLANHVPSIEQLKPGLVEIIEESGGSKQFFLSGGFATVQPDSQLSINAVEGYALEDFSAEVHSVQDGRCDVRRATNKVPGRQEPDCGGAEDCRRKRQRPGYCRG
jgi:F0F1-type ATP synthase epsilon subunit